MLLLFVEVLDEFAYVFEVFVELLGEVEIALYPGVVLVLLFQDAAHELADETNLVDGPFVGLLLVKGREGEYCAIGW